MRYAVFGATGAVGKALAPLLAATNERFRVVGRSVDRLRREFSRYEPQVEYVVADFADARAARAAAEDVDTVFYLVGVPCSRFKLHPRYIRSALDASAEAGVRRFVHVSTVYPYGLPKFARVDELHPREPHTFVGRMRKEQEDLVFTADGRNGMRTAVVRPPDFYGPGSELNYPHAIFRAALHGGTANVIGPVNTPHEFIYVPDLAAALIALARKEEAYGNAWNVGGPGTITTLRFAKMVFAKVNAQPRLRATNKFLLRAMGMFNPFLREVAEMHYLWTMPVVLDDARLRELLPEWKKTPYEEGIRQTLAAMRARYSDRDPERPSGNGSQVAHKSARPVTRAASGAST